MGAFGNYPHHQKQVIDFDKLHVVPVVATFSSDGKIRPDYFGYVDQEGMQHRFKIDTIKSFKDKGDTISYCCVYINHGRQFEVILTFYVMECQWIIG